ncbi:MAG: hypothetical protein EXR69_05740 [Myxococcales bacterium]|nr:hypothetical protein [Myxococcales bacterium]
MDDTGPPVPEPAEAGEIRLGHTARGTAANDVVLALTRAARSFLLYDPSNMAIRQFLDMLRLAVEAYCTHHGELSLAVRPFELVAGGEVVYLDRDRERSLAFRLYRDGVRRMSLRADVPWLEVLKLLEVLSIRYIGVRQTEDDMVVLLWKAGFQHIEIEAVEGFVPDEEVDDFADPTATDAQTEAPPTHSGALAVDAPADFDLPAPELTLRRPVQHADLPDIWRDGLVAEDAMHHMPDMCLRLVDHMLRAVEDPSVPLSFSQILPQLREIRDFTLTDGQLPVVLEIIGRLAYLSLPPTHTVERDTLLTSFADARGLGRLIHSVPVGLRSTPPELVTLLQMVPGDHLQTLTEVMEQDHGEAGRRVLRTLVERYVVREGEHVVDCMLAASPAVACELLRALRYTSLPRAVDAVRLASGRNELDFELGALRVLEAAPISNGTTALLGAYVASGHAESRLWALTLLTRRAKPAAFPNLLERIRGLSARTVPTAEAVAYGEALAASDPAHAMEIFREWIRPKGLFAVLAAPILQVIAVSGLVHLPGDEAESLIKIASEKGGTDLQRHCTTCMVKRRRVARGAEQ